MQPCIVSRSATQQCNSIAIISIHIYFSMFHNCWKSFTNMEKIKGWTLWHTNSNGTPLIWLGTAKLDWLLSSTHIAFKPRKSITYKTIVCQLVLQISWFTQSNALAKSKKPATTNFCVSIWLHARNKTHKSTSWVEWDGCKQDWQISYTSQNEKLIFLKMLEELTWSEIG